MAIPITIPGSISITVMTRLTLLGNDLVWMVDSNAEDECDNGDGDMAIPIWDGIEEMAEAKGAVVDEEYMGAPSHGDGDGDGDGKGLVTCERYWGWGWGWCDDGDGKS